MKRYPQPYPPTTDAQKAVLLALVERVLTPSTDPFGNTHLAPLAANSPEFVALKVKPHQLILGIEPATAPLAAAISLIDPKQIGAKFGSLEKAVAAGQTLRNGAALLYGLEAAAMRYGDVRAAEALIAGASAMTIFFQYSHWLVEMVEPKRMDALLLGLMPGWDAHKQFIIWILLEHHPEWSIKLSRAVLDATAAALKNPRSSMWRWGGNGYSDHVHASLIPEAIELIKPWVKTEPNARRWTTKLKKRAKAA